MSRAMTEATQWGNRDGELHAIRARWLFPVAGPPIRDGWIAFRNGRIEGLGTWAAPVEAVDLGRVAIIPGLVNAHTHLELSDTPRIAASCEPTSERSMAAWIRQVIAFRRGRNNQPPDVSPVELGLAESTRLGTTTLADIAQPGWSAEPYAHAACDGTILLELIAPRIERIATAVKLAESHQAAPLNWQLGLSPHAPYSVHPELLRRAVALSAARSVPLAVHLAESREELELLRAGAGPLVELLQELGAWDPTALVPNWRPDKTGTGSEPCDSDIVNSGCREVPVPILSGILGTLARASRVLVIHGNYLADDELDLLATHRRHMAVVYCPRTHAWFGHLPYPLEAMLARGVAVALGTDSRASSPDLSMLAEIREVARRHPSIPRDVVLGLGTIDAARALGRDDVGRLAVGTWANLAAVALPEREMDDPHALLLDSDLPVLQTYFRGQPVAAAETGHG